ncbi:MAG: glycoside hydrolase family 38 C-terminal domain-containing protein, partial [Microbacteriaceae bacterium]
PYPAARLEKIWQDVLLHQFHDILPGTSIAWVHREARDEYARLERELLELVTAATDALDAAGELATAPAATASTPATTLATTAEGGEDDSDDIVLDNGVLRVVVAADGYISSLVQLEDDVEIVSRDARLGELQLFRDEPVRWDAWDLDRHVLRHPRPIEDVAEREIVVDGDDRGVRVVRRAGASTIETTTWLRSGADLVETECDVDWQEREQLLKVAFPVDVRATTARFETQYGYVERPMHTNTAADEAMFEASVQRYIHVSDGARGVAILNRAICGADARTDDRGVGSVVRLSLLRGARFPDPDADLGQHHLSWAVRPGARHADVVDAATAYVAPAERHPGLPELVGVESTSGHLVVDWVKQAADGSGDLIARVYETDGAHARGRLTAHPALAGHSVVETDLIERPFPEDGPPRGLVVPDDAPADGSGRLDGAELRLSPFQITTLRITAPIS